MRVGDRFQVGRYPGFQQLYKEFTFNQGIIRRRIDQASFPPDHGDDE
jgi:hypothetical protein